MQTKAIFALLITAITAAPSLVDRAATVPVDVYSGSGCNDLGDIPRRTNIPTDGSCTVVPGINPPNRADSFRVASSLPPGCAVEFWWDTTCSSVNTIYVTSQNASSCFTFGGSLQVRSARTLGTC